ncbi:membrane integrity-associated transporter subunit PqiC [Chitinimonas arctica]|uniref:Membrane integrity-associated transporter subunit PqiC n=1 Tax=Chitinimonas arctica TaxID=2594795 RepID=A0A516SAA5_9NEIS|nr:ABC-type transport auxiliary lipoprotein family protein [Chitinimonas arctica]QDQ25081.1 membrane integrity-associated transporter subunit PqiC [Chitinimonas arctica]
MKPGPCQATFFACLLLAACGTTPPARFFSLVPDTADSTAIAAAEARIALGPLTIPEAIDRPQLVLRRGADIEIREQLRWLQPPKADIAAAMAARLGRLLGRPVFTQGQAGANGARYRVALDVIRFDSELGLAASETVAWSIYDAQHRLVRSGQSGQRVRCRDDSYGALFEAHAQAQAGIAAALAADLRSLP